MLAGRRKNEPAAVLAHRAGQWWNFESVPPTVYTIFALVSSFRVAVRHVCYSSLQVAAFLMLFPAYSFYPASRATLVLH
jgi:hypothetical protein